MIEEHESDDGDEFETVPPLELHDIIESGTEDEYDTDKDESLQDLIRKKLNQV